MGHTESYACGESVRRNLRRSSRRSKNPSVFSRGECQSGVTHKIIILSDAHTSVTNLLRDKNGRNFVIIHMESENGNVYRDLIYPSMRVLNSRGGNNEAMAYMEKTLKTVQSLIFDVVKRKGKDRY